MNAPENLRYAATHEWVRVEGDTAVVGITDFAQHELGDVVYLDLPEVGRQLTKGAPFGAVESVKAVSDLYAPVSGEIVEINQPLMDAPESINTAPYDAGWMLKIRMSDAAETDSLLDAKEYAASAAH